MLLCLEAWPPPSPEATHNCSVLSLLPDVDERKQGHGICQGSTSISDKGNYICNCPPGLKFTPEGLRRCTGRGPGKTHEAGRSWGGAQAGPE